MLHTQPNVGDAGSEIDEAEEAVQNAFQRQEPGGPATELDHGLSNDFWTPAEGLENDPQSSCFATKRVWMPLKLTHNGDPLLSRQDAKKMLKKVKFADRRIQDNQEWMYARSRDCPIYGAIAASNGLDTFGKTSCTLRRFLKTVSGKSIPNAEFVGLMRVFAGFPDQIGGLTIRCNRPDCTNKANPIHARDCHAGSMQRKRLHDRIRDLLQRLLAGLDDVLAARIEQKYHGTNKYSDVVLSLTGGGERHLDVSVLNTASYFFSKFRLQDAYGAHPPLAHIFDDIANDGVQRALQSRFQSKVTQYRTALHQYNIPDSEVPSSTDEFDVTWNLADFRPIIFDATGTLHSSSQKWLKGMLGAEKWATFTYEASEIFATFYGGILRTVTSSWVQPEERTDPSSAAALLDAFGSSS